MKKSILEATSASASAKANPDRASMATLSAARLCETAENLAMGGKHKEALRVLNFAAAKYPACQRAYQLKGYSFISLRRFGPALAAFKKCLALAPQRKYYHFYFGRVYAVMKKYSLAIDEYRKAMDSSWPYDKNFCNAVIYRQLGLAFVSWRKPAEALWCYEKVLSLGDHFGAPLRKRAADLKKRKVQPKEPVWVK